jgi:hypothetical protein
MVSLMSLWLPILLSGVVVFLVSALIHMVLPYHRTDVERLPGEDEVMAALRAVAAPPGDYLLPYAGSPAAMKDPAYIEKVKQGPAAFFTVFPPIPSGRPGMGAQLAQWFVYCVVVSLFAGYIASRALAPGDPGGEVLRFAGATAFAGYALALPQGSIWWRRKWSATLKSVFDGLIYALLTGAVFASMWPGA